MRTFVTTQRNFFFKMAKQLTLLLQQCTQANKAHTLALAHTHTCNMYTLAAGCNCTRFFFTVRHPCFSTCAFFTFPWGGQHLLFQIFSPKRPIFFFRVYSCAGVCILFFIYFWSNKKKKQKDVQCGCSSIDANPYRLDLLEDDLKNDFKIICFFFFFFFFF